MPGKISLSVYMLKPARVDEVRGLFTNPLPLTNGLEGIFINFPTQATVPTWFQQVQLHLPTGTSIDVRGQSSAGMMLVERGAHHFAIAFGHAWQYLDLAWVEPDFGRRVALETIPPDKVIELNSEQVFAKFHSARERAPRATSIREFGVESERDLVGGIEGVPSDAVFGKVLRGATSLRLKVHLHALNGVLDKAVALFIRDNYGTIYPHMDNLLVVRDTSTSAMLDQLLDRDLISGIAKASAILIAPSFRHGDADSADAFAFGRRAANQATAPYLQYGSWERHLRNSGLTPSLESAQKTPVHMIDEAGDVFETRTVYDCLGYELSHAGLSYVLSSGIWYIANLQFTATIDRILGAIPVAPYALPAWNGIQREDEYNKLCCTGSGLLHFDKKIISYGGGRSKFEFCDFMDAGQRILYFAKITGRSCDSSHLVEQVRRTAELLFSSDGRFRKKLEGAMKKHYPNTARIWLRNRPRPGDWQFCLVSLGRSKQSLPLFAKCSVARLSKSMDQVGHPLLFTSV